MKSCIFLMSFNNLLFDKDMFHSACTSRILPNKGNMNKYMKFEKIRTNIYNHSRLFTAMWSLKLIVQYECIHVTRLRRVDAYTCTCMFIMHVLA